MQTNPIPLAQACAVPVKVPHKSEPVLCWIDEADEEWAKQFKWYLHPDGYAVRNVSRRESGDKRNRTEKMHREILRMRVGDPRQVDHINRDPLDNRKSNLRIVTRKQNSHNQGVNKRKNRSSTHRGVSFYKKTNRWMAYCRIDGKLHHLGYFREESEAAEAAAKFRREHMSHCTD